MSPLARRLYPLGVLLAGLVAAFVVAVMSARERVRARDDADRRAVAQLAAGLRTRLQLLSRTVRGPAQAFDLGTLGRPELAGVLRLSYTQSEGVTAVTLLERDGTAIVPAVFVARATGTEHPSESLDDLDRFAREIPHDQALARGRALRGPYATVRADGARIAFAEAVPVSEGTRTWVLAAEIDVANLLDGLYPPDPDGDPDVALVAPGVTVGRLDRVPPAARTLAAQLARSPQSVRGPDVLAGDGFRIAVAPAPDGVDGVLVIARAGEPPSARRARERELGLALVVATIMGALAAALWVLTRESSPEPAPPDAASAPSTNAPADATGKSRALSPRRARTPAPRSDEPVTDAARALGAVIKELSNPIAATTAAARLMSTEPGVGGRVIETLQRSAVRLERAFRRVTRLARAGEEQARRDVDVAALVRRECDALRAEIEQGGHTLATVLPAADSPCIALADEEDVLLLLEVLVDAARGIGPAGTEITVKVSSSPRGEPEISVADRGTLGARERQPLLRLVEAPRTEVAAPALAWALAARIARDQHASLEMAELEGPGPGPGARAVVRFEPSRSAARG